MINPFFAFSNAFKIKIVLHIITFSLLKKLLGNQLSTDRRCFAIVTDERALLSKLGQPVRKVIQTPYCVFRRVNTRLKTAPFAQWYGALSISATDTN